MKRLVLRSRHPSFLSRRLWRLRRICAAQRHHEAKAQHARRMAQRARPYLWRLLVGSHHYEEALEWNGFLGRLIGALSSRLELLKGCVVGSVAGTTADQMVDAALDTSALAARPEGVVCQPFAVPITRRHLACLLPDQWLNDEVVNCYFRILQDKGGGAYWCLNSFFWPLLEERGHWGVRRWSARAGMDVARLSAVLMPIHLKGCHWALGVLDIKARGFRYYDSLGYTPPVKLVPRLHEYFEGELAQARLGCKGQHQGIQNRRQAPWVLLQSDRLVPQQQNTFDCGVFMCAFAERFIAGAPIYFETHPASVMNLRRGIAMAVLAGRISETIGGPHGVDI